MNIAYIGWGSLIWNSRYLRKKDEWKTDGPLLPIEFARISEQTPLTLVLFPKVKEVPTLWIHTEITELDEAINALATRQGTSKSNIGFYSKKDQRSRCKVVPEILDTIITWINEREIDVVIWKDLESNFEKKFTEIINNEHKKIKLEMVLKKEFNEENVLDYLLYYLTEMETEKERVYVTKTHPQIDTKMRFSIKQETGWRHISEYKNGFWLDKNTYIKADNAKIKKVTRHCHNQESKTEEAEMLILNKVVEMTVDKNGKILNAELKPNMGLWLDTVNKAIANKKTEST